MNDLSTGPVIAQRPPRNISLCNTPSYSSSVSSSTCSSHLSPSAVPTHPLPTRPPPHHQAANLPPGNAAFATAETTLDPTWNFRHATALDMSSSVPKNRRTRQTGRVIAFNIAIHIASPNLVCQVHTSCWQHHHDNDATPVPPHARSTTKVSATPPYALTSTDIPTRPLTDDDDD